MATVTLVALTTWVHVRPSYRMYGVRLQGWDFLLETGSLRAVRRRSLANA